MKVSVVIPTVNERRALPAAIARLRESAGTGGLEVVVADGASTDGTVSLARRCADSVVECAARGRAVQMHAGALAATGELLLFLHADTRLPEGWREALLEAWSGEPRPGATAFRLGFDSPKLVYRVIASLARWRSRRTQVPHGDQALACRKDDYLAAGGFPPAPLMEEYLLIPKLAALGPVVELEEEALTSVRRYERNGPLRNAIRNAALVALFKAGVPPERLARAYR